MKILHTSDWHLGHKLYSNFREEEHEIFFDWLVDTINNEKIDVLLVAGDIFDVAFPSNQALTLYYKSLTRIAASYCKHVVIIGGNHDSVSTLNAPREILHYLNISIVGGALSNPDEEIIEIKENGTTQLVVCAVPFLRDNDLRASVSGQTYAEKTQALRDGIKKHYAGLAEKTNFFKENNIPVIAMGHLFATGALTSDSERDIYIGNLGNVSATDIQNHFDYLALGHIHRPQMVGGKEEVRYSGSPIPLSFSEKNDNKQVVIIEFNNKQKNIKLLDIPLSRKLILIKGTFDEVAFQLKNFQKESKLKAWAEIIVEEEKHIPENKQKLDKLIAQSKNPEVLKYSFRSLSENIEKEGIEENIQLSDLKITEVFYHLLSEKNIEKDDEMEAALLELIENLHKENNEI